jgi:hypothetical protein
MVFTILDCLFTKEVQIKVSACFYEITYPVLIVIQDSRMLMRYRIDVPVTYSIYFPSVADPGSGAFSPLDPGSRTG